MNHPICGDQEQEGLNTASSARAVPVRPAVSVQTKRSTTGQIYPDGAFDWAGSGKVTYKRLWDIMG